MYGVKYVVDSGNKKIAGTSKVDATYVSIQNSCPSTCKLKGEGCYAELGPVGIHVARLDREAVNLTALQLARNEARAIDSAYGGKDIPNGRNLRLHVSGDCRSPSGAKIVNASIGRWKDRGGNIAWSYTHGWDKVLREEWSNVSMLASVDSFDEIEAARANGYAPSIVVSEHSNHKIYTLPTSNVKWVPCLAQVRGISCTDCRICFNADRLFAQNKGVAFAVHGVRKNIIKRRLKVI